MHKGILYALLAALLFGAGTPFAKLLAEHVAPFALAGMLYLGSGAGLLAVYVVRAAKFREVKQAGASGASLGRGDLPWLAGAIMAGGIAGPVLLMLGLSLTPASSTSLLLNMEGVLTALLAWCVFRENVDRRIFAGMLMIVAAGIILSWQQMPQSGAPWGPLCIIGACLCWAVDNNLTRKISASDAVQIAGLKGLVAGSVNVAIALASGLTFPAVQTVLAAGLLGFCSYGLSLVLFVLALRHLGTARTGAYFSVAPFAGAALSLALLGESAGWAFWLAAALMGAGIWLHLMEHHAHTHQHEEMEHAHAHSHDEHHGHEHDFTWDGKEPHVHPHHHAVLVHAHPHYPDIHHRHEHKKLKQ
ncbi:DMT family transporter [Undibacterium sp. TJN25]|uniref:DMT family transporter n=1 Tax=Undibacterium sp. TJN25 TaxID=3413056 RepID=UPI003BF1BE80